MHFPRPLIVSAFLAIASPSVVEADLVINEVHYDSDPTVEFIEFVELLNTGPDPIDLSNWSFTNGISVAFPPGTTLGVAKYLLLAEDPAALAARFTSIQAGTPVFHYTGSLSNDGEKLELRDTAGSLVDSVDYRAEFPWPIASNGEGSSMQLINATLDNDLGGSWRAALPTPGLPNAVFATNAPPAIRQVNHAPETPTANTPITITAKITDPEGVASASLLYQIVAPGSFIPAFLPNDYNTVRNSPDTPLRPNPAFENPANWTTLALRDDGTAGDLLAGDGVFTAVVPGQPNRTLVRYRITVADVPGASARVPYPDDPSLNFACFVYNGVPDYVAAQNSVHPDGPGHIYPASLLTKFPVYTMITRDSDRSFAYAYSTTGQSGLQLPKGNGGREVYNWECALVYDGIVYDHVGWRLRQNNDRYTGDGKRSMRYQLNRGHYFQARDEEGKKLPFKWRRMNTSKMSRFGSSNNYGFYETINSKLWRMVGVECPLFLPAHFRMIDGAAEAPDQYNGDFFGLATIVEDIDGRLLDNRGLPSGNMYKLKDGVTSALELQRNQARDAVTDGSDFLNIKNNLNPTQNDAWLRNHVDWDEWTRYHAVVEAVRHYDYGTPSTHFKNRAWYFSPQPGTPYGLLRVIPHDHDASWSKGYHDSLNSVGNSIGTGFPWAAIFGGNTRPAPGPEKTDFTRDYRNFIREFRDLLWREETVNALIDDNVALLRDFTFADRDRWTGGPAAAGVESMVPIESVAAPMKSIAFESDTMYGANLVGGRGAFLELISADAAIPNQPAISYTGPPGFPAGSLVLSSSAFSDPQGAGTFGKMKWRIAEVAGLGGGPTSTPLVVSGDAWKYFDTGTDPGANWALTTYSDVAWGSGPTQIGYGETDEATTVAGGHATTYFRKKITLADVGDFSGFNAGIVRDDGVIVYVNGVEVYRNQMPAGPVTFETLASASATGSNETAFQLFTIPAARFLNGVNTIAVEMHQTPALSGDMSFDFYLNGEGALPARKFEWIADWESGESTTFQRTINPPALATRAGRTYRARVRHADNTGRWSHWSEPLAFTASQPDLSLFTDSLVISEIMYHPTDPTAAEITAGFPNDDAFEYVEIRNVGNQTIDLSNVRFTKGVDFNFPAGTLAPGAYTLVVANPAAFTLRYGAGHPIAGAWSGKLDNGGEQLKLSFGAGETIRDFVYDDVPPWPTSPDGGGPSLVLVDPFGLPDHGDPLSWRAGAATPGATDGMTFPGGDSAAFLAYATGPTPSNVSVLPDGNLAFTVELNQLAEDVIGAPEVSNDLVNWQPGTLTRTAVAHGPSGRAIFTFSTGSPPAGTRWFARYRLERR
jgi:hypothetical protein